MQTLQKRSTRNDVRQNLNTRDIVLGKDEDVHCNDWPLGWITKVIKSEDSKVRRPNWQVELLKEGKTYLCPIKELVLSNLIKHSPPWTKERCLLF